MLEKQTFKQYQFNLLAKNRFKMSYEKLSNANSAFQPHRYLLEWLLSFFFPPFSLSLFYTLYTTRMPPKLFVSSSSDIVGIYSRLAKVLTISLCKADANVLKFLSFKFVLRVYIVVAIAHKEMQYGNKESEH
jgi:hypothetical protein